MIRKTSDILSGFEYFVKGSDPKLLIHSGTHGDEFDVIDVVREAVEKYEEQLPDFIYVPVVSPSAVKQKSRFNLNEKDMNRIFFNDSSDIEVKENMKVISGNKFDLFVSFHEDPEAYEYYIYDEGLDFKKSENILKNNKNLVDLGVKLLNGVDDPNDPHLGIEFVDGYRKFVVTDDHVNTGMISSWSLSEGLVKDTLVPEIPGKASMKEKALIVDTFFKDVLCTN